jgi:hypothetical protein
MIRFVQQMVGWWRAKRCLSGRHKWDSFPYKPGIMLQKCRWCHAELFVGNAP